jgi:hypothetical protein
VKGLSGDDEADAEEVPGRRDLAEDDDTVLDFEVKDPGLVGVRTTVDPQELAYFSKIQAGARAYAKIVPPRMDLLRVCLECPLDRETLIE